MTQTISNYARVLYELSVPEEKISEAVCILRENPGLLSVLKNPVILFHAKEQAVGRIFPSELCSFMKVICRNGRAGEIFSVFEAYEAYAKEQEGVLKAVITFVTPPSEDQLENMKAFLCRKYQKKDVEFELRKDSSLLGGFTLQAGGYEYDYSLKGRYQRLEEKLIRR